MLRVLILGGTTQASALAARLAGDARYDAILSLAGRTQNPLLPEISHRIGGFGGVAGLTNYLRTEKIDVLIDATHPFAEQISAHAAAAARETGTPLAVFTRRAWTPGAGDRWREFPDAASAARSIGATPRRVFLTIGRLQLGAFVAAPQHDYLIRTIDPPEPPPALPHYKLLLARGPFGLEDEVKLMREAGIEILVTKNSGGEATRAKLDAARALGIEVFMIGRPYGVDTLTFETLDAVLQFLERHSHRISP
ncbi:cobalt-precorrin-6A reductase [Methylovirgula ligni]|uniref:Precorrin-6A reductase n=2 Tax=Methylovirgula ligni TaxID=569860 RepID=A0A3D9Z226_9HYPH|nr:cobalt-precorrin-6A reductase [Methylovirgula ligni]QAY97235.1 cobalt-precorrin-6A reductase [Methylovirgula ligni]REF89223.1 precorrin-6A reductase [Methylovirgula ligni]